MRTIVICSNCRKNTPEGKFCEHCGASLQSTQTFQQPVVQNVGGTVQPPVVKKEKNALLAALLSFIFTGSGQVYNGQTGKGIGILIGAIIGYFIFVIPGVLVFIYGIYDAYTTAQKMNKGEVPYVEVSNRKVIGFIIVEIVIFFIVIIMVAVFIAAISTSPYYSR